MATLPRASTRGSGKPPFTPPSISNEFFSALSRQQSEFDAGLNMSAAWTEHLDRASGSLSDEEPDDDLAEVGTEKGRSARALYQFEGKAEFRELSVEAGDELGVVNEELADGWSLVRNAAGEIGLLPRTYYTFTADFAVALDVELPTASPRKEAFGASITPRASPIGRTEALPIVPQTTGEWRPFPSVRQSLLGGKSLNRFSNFVTSGAEEWVLQGTASSLSTPSGVYKKETNNNPEGDEDDHSTSRLGAGEADRHFIDVGPSWKTKLPPFRVLVHSPSKCASTLSGGYTVYNVTSLFDPLFTAEAEAESEFEDESLLPASPARITVYRRFSHFVVLHTVLTRRLPGIALPPLPEKQYAGRFSSDFVEARRGDLERYIGRIVRQPVARYAEVVMFFLGCESELEWKRQLPHHLSLPPAGPSFFAQVYHPAFNVDAEEATEAAECFDSHTRAVGKGVQSLREAFGPIRQARIEMSHAERLLSYSLLSLVSSKPMSSSSITGINEEQQDQPTKTKGLVNSDNAWCWREHCKGCLRLTKAVQKTSETLQSVADLYEDHASRTQLATHESLKGVAHPHALYEPVLDIHHSTLSRYNDSVQEGEVDEEMLARCETVLNTTMAEMDTYHTQKVEDFSTITKEHLDGEINLYEQILSKLRTAREIFDGPQYEQFGDAPRQPSMYERKPKNLRLSSKPLSQPCPHVYDSAPMRPVSVAIQEGMGLLLGNSNPTGRSSVFGKFW